MWKRISLVSLLKFRYWLNALNLVDLILSHKLWCLITMISSFCIPEGSSCCWDLSFAAEASPPEMTYRSSGGRSWQRWPSCRPACQWTYCCCRRWAWSRSESLPPAGSSCGRALSAFFARKFEACRTRVWAAGQSGKRSCPEFRVSWWRVATSSV